MFSKLTEYYILSHLKEVIGLEPTAAAQVLRASIIGHEFRCFRIVEDIALPDGSKYAEEEPYHGRISFKTDGEGKVSEVWFEDCKGLTRVLISTKDKFSPFQDPGVLHLGEVFFLGEPTFVGKLLPRRDVSVFDQRAVCPNTRRGWFIENIEHIAAVSLPKEPDRPIQRRRIQLTQSPRFTHL